MPVPHDELVRNRLIEGEIHSGEGGERLPGHRLQLHAALRLEGKAALWQR
jgi:hypothetical protein